MIAQNPSASVNTEILLTKYRQIEKQNNGYLISSWYVIQREQKKKVIGNCENLQGIKREKEKWNFVQKALVFFSN